MKSLIITITMAFSLIPIITNSQTTWAPNGATWFYNYQSFENEGYQKIEYVKDSTYNGQLCKVLERSLHYYDYVNQVYHDNIMDSVLTYEENNIVYFYNSSENQFELLYDFTLIENEYWNIKGLYSGCDSYGVQFVDSVKTTSINGFNLIQQFTHPTDTSKWSFDNLIFERIGSDYEMFPEPLCITYEVVSGLRCYYDDDFGWYHYDETDCDYITEINDIETQLGFNMFPNPVNDNFTVKVDNNNESNIQVLDISGKVVYQQNFTKTINISTDKYIEGIYFVKVKNNDNIIIRKIIVE